MTAGPPRKKGRAATRMVSARLTDLEWERLDLALTASGLSRSDFCRRALLGRTIAFRPFEPLLAEAIALLAHCHEMRAEQAVELQRMIGDVERLVSRLSRLAGTDVK
ncbi:plasmid mobilization protein [Sphingomonas morindae]|uniref:Mobilization protein n=1 Tax=Sphingomonas morindae TaxID=1541170 RepID=A0ABY4X7G9_9SPHN|nr:hypothetical protein [Sphingomonas morindae]USI72871.1 hypothetical protein LHA26_16650 [Sphingomonas morindae]